MNYDEVDESEGMNEWIIEVIPSVVALSKKRNHLRRSDDWPREEDRGRRRRSNDGISSDLLYAHVRVSNDLRLVPVSFGQCR